VHDLWLQHSELARHELLLQRDEMLAAIVGVQRECTDALEMLRLKLEQDLAYHTSASTEMLTEAQRSLDASWNQMEERRVALFALQSQIDDDAAAAVRHAKELLLREEVQVARIAQRRQDLEEWARTAHQQVLEREAAVVDAAQRLEVDLSAFAEEKAHVEARRDKLAKDAATLRAAQQQLLEAEEDMAEAARRTRGLGHAGPALRGLSLTGIITPSVNAPPTGAMPNALRSGVRAASSSAEPCAWDVATSRATTAGCSRCPPPVGRRFLCSRFS
jgi:hypothetical protein